MKSLLLAFIATAVICCVSSVELDEKVAELCLGNYEITIEETKYLFEDDNPPKEIGCAMGCLMENMNATDPETLEWILKAFGKDFREGNMHVYKDCFEEILGLRLENGCETGDRTMKCLKKNYPPNKQ